MDRYPRAIAVVRNSYNNASEDLLDGIYTCIILDADDNLQTLYVGAGLTGELTCFIKNRLTFHGLFHAEPLRNSTIFLELNQSNVACISSGRPVDSVTWYKNGVELVENGTFTTNQTILDPYTAVYRHDLFIDDIVGVFQCELTDFEGNVVQSNLGIYFSI